MSLVVFSLDWFSFFSDLWVSCCALSFIALVCTAAVSFWPSFWFLSGKQNLSIIMHVWGKKKTNQNSGKLVQQRISMLVLVLMSHWTPSCLCCMRALPPSSVNERKYHEDIFSVALWSRRSLCSSAVSPLLRAEQQQQWDSQVFAECLLTSAGAAADTLSHASYQHH